MNKNFQASYKFGLIGGAFCVIAFVIFHYTGIDPTNFSMLFGYILLPVFLFIGIRFYRNEVKGGELSFSNGMSVGFLIYSIIAAISGIGIWLILLVSPSLFEEIKTSKIAVLEKNKDLIISQMSEESFQTTYKSILEMTQLDVALNDFIWKIIPGLFFTIIISIILRRNFK